MTRWPKVTDVAVFVTRCGETTELMEGVDYEVSQTGHIRFLTRRHEGGDSLVVQANAAKAKTPKRIAQWKQKSHWWRK
jgi:hypothetical protein